ncbi:protein TonB [Tenacibaculum adriaticum]|uniref:Protein TonB n=1 Tax=Tenacibaculum adriaticum TaxID=413713 RepID=A0A5S5DWK6_9FLAO|nr:energy transducer TonB [Tenacibaculum adriaticum]TYP99658.1 protein TonB [Tenacibaculum adriaticum]
MKITKKSPTQQLEKFSTVFTQLGLVLVLFIVFISLEYETEQKAMIIREKDYDSTLRYIIDVRPIIFEKDIPKSKVIEQTQKRVVNNLSDIDIVKEKLEQSIINLPKEDVNDVKVLNPDDIKEVKIEETIIEEIPFVSVQNIPVFAGCEGLSEEENKKCFERKIQRLIQRNFNADLGNELELHHGKHKIITQFVIDKTGKVSDVKIRAPHVRLKKETERVVNKIPKFTPGKHNGKPVKVRYTLPITFQVE